MFENLNFFFNEGEQKDEYIRRKEEQRKKEDDVDRGRFERRYYNFDTPRSDFVAAGKQMENIDPNRFYEKMMKAAEKTNIPKSEVLSFIRLYRRSDIDPKAFIRKYDEIRRNPEWNDLARHTGVVQALDATARKIRRNSKHESTIFENVRFLDD